MLACHSSGSSYYTDIIEMFNELFVLILGIPADVNWTSEQRIHWGQYKFTVYILFREVVLFLEVVNNVLKSWEECIFGTSSSVPCREVYYILTLSQRVPYQRFYYIINFLELEAKERGLHQHHQRTRSKAHKWFKVHAKNSTVALTSPPLVS